MSRPLGKLVLHHQSQGAAIRATSEEARRAGLEMTQAGHETLVEVLIVLGKGFWASAIRGVTRATVPPKGGHTFEAVGVAPPAGIACT